jgi:alpha-L-fucosidase 2
MQKIEFSFPLPRAHAGIAMGNGLFGALIWGKDSINITVNRADFWDHRGEFHATEGVTTYENIKKSYNPTDLAWMEDVFPVKPKPPHVGNPSRLPFGRFEMKLKSAHLPVRGELDLANGTVTVWISAEGKKVKHPVQFDLSVNQNVLWIQDPDKMICGVTVKTAWEFVGERLRSLGFREPVSVEKSDAWGWAQECPADPAMAAICQQTNNGYVFALDRGTDASKAIATAGRMALNAGKKGVESIRKSNKEWWTAYWERVPQITLPDDFFNKFYLYAMYKLGAATNPLCPWPAGLQGPWVEEYQWPPWNADYHFNVNVQQVYSLAFGSNQLGHIMPLFDRLDSWCEVLRRNAKVLLGIDDGLIIGMCVDDRGEMLGLGPGVLIDHACSGWIAQMYWQYYLYTGDVKFLRDRAYPFMHGVMRVYEEMLEEKDGRLSIPLCISAEFGNDIRPRLMGKDPSWQLACIHMLADALLETSRILKKQPRPIWKEIKEKLPLYTLIGKPGEEHIAIWEGQDLDFCHRHHSHLSCIYPFDSLGELTPEKQEILENSIDHWISKGMGHWSEWCMPWAAIIHARMGFKDSPWLILQMWRKLFVNEGLATVYIPRFRGLSVHRSSLKELRMKPLETTETMQLDGTMGAATALYEMLVHNRGGMTHIFPGVPDDMKDISFSNIRVPGAFLISAERKDFKLKSINIKSLIGGEITIQVDGNPKMKLSRGKQKNIPVQLPLTISCKPGEIMILTSA